MCQAAGPPAAARAAQGSGGRGRWGRGSQPPPASGTQPPPGRAGARRGRGRAPRPGGAVLAPAFQETEIETVAAAAPVPRPRLRGGRRYLRPSPPPGVSRGPRPSGPGAGCLRTGGRRGLSRRPAGKRGWRGAARGRGDGRERDGTGLRCRRGGGSAAPALALRLGRLAGVTEGPGGVRGGYSRAGPWPGCRRPRRSIRGTRRSRGAEG